MAFSQTPIRDFAVGLVSKLYNMAIDPLLNLGNDVSEAITNGGVLGEAFGQYFGDNGLISNAATYLKPGGYAIALLFFIIAMIDLVADERFTSENFIKFFAKFAGAIGAVFFADQLVTVITGEWATAFITDLGGAISIEGGATPASSGAAFYNAMHTFATSGGGGTWLVIILIGLVLIVPMMFATNVLKLVALVVCITRSIELIIRGIFLPIALSLWAEDGFRGAAGRYLKKYIALAAQGGVLVLIANLGSTGISAVMNSMAEELIEESSNLSTKLSGMASNTASYFDILGVILSNFIAVAAIGFGTVSVMFKSIGLINDVFGV